MRAVFYLKSEIIISSFTASCVRQNVLSQRTLTIEKNVIAEERLEELLQILEKIFCERCGMHFKVQTVFKEPVESKSHKNSELRIQQEVDAILQNAVLGNPEEPQNLPEENGQVEAAKAEGKAEAAKKEKAKPEKKNDGKSEKSRETSSRYAKRQRKFPGKRRIPFRIFQRRRISQRASLGQSGCALRT